MTTRKALIALLSLLLITIAFPMKTSAQNPLTPQERRGKQIYFRGESPSATNIVALIGENSLEIPGNGLPCAGCHGVSGRGKPEGDVDPSNVSWEALLKSSQIVGTRKRTQPYSVTSLETAITRGLDPSGNKLAVAMPRYQMTKQDLQDLIVYMRRLGTDRDQGIYDDKIVIGTAIPTTGKLAEMGQVIKQTINAAIDDVNFNGGIYNRRLELKFVETGSDASATAASIAHFIQDENVFAMVDLFLAGAEKEIMPLLAEREVPLVGPFTLLAKVDTPINRQVFYLLPGIAEQARALVSFAAKRVEGNTQRPRIAAIYLRSDLNSSVLEGVKLQCQKEGLSAPQVYEYQEGSFDAAQALQKLKQSDPSAIFFIGTGSDLTLFMSAADMVGWYPQILVPGVLAGADIVNARSGFDGKLFLTFPSVPEDITAEGQKQLQALSEKYKLPPKHMAAQVAAYAGVKILIEGLKRAGIAPNREALIQALEGLKQYQTGLTPLISYSPTRRIGAMGGYVVSIDLKQKRMVVNGWVSIE